MAEVHYKLLKKDLNSLHGHLLFSNKALPYKVGNTWIPGAWLPIRRNICLCRRGWHFFTSRKQMERYMKAHHFYKSECILYRVEVSGKVLRDSTKAVAEEMRFLRQVSFTK